MEIEELNKKAEEDFMVHPAVKDKLKEVYEAIYTQLDKFCDTTPENLNIITLWILGTHMHKEFVSYPYLFINAMKGSGKTRLLKLIKHMAYNGKLTGSISEAVMFRTASDSTFCIDEFERVASKDNKAIRELLNAAYKQGAMIERTKKVTTKGVETYSTEKFDVYCPIAMANIWGMEEVLDDRCITIQLDRSDDLIKTRLMEIFDDIYYQDIVKSVGSVVSVRKKNIYRHWNNYISSVTTDTNNTNNIQYTTNTTDTNNSIILSNDMRLYDFFDEIFKININGRHLELFMALFIISYHINKDILKKTLNFAKNYVHSKKQEDIMESRDVILIDFLAKINRNNNTMYLLKDITHEFKEFYGEDVEWINEMWVSRALKRLGLVIEKVRHGNGRKIRINFTKATEKIKMFKSEEVVKVEQV